jgi:hypothetical protein
VKLSLSILLLALPVLADDVLVTRIVTRETWPEKRVEFQEVYWTSGTNSGVVSMPSRASKTAQLNKVEQDARSKGVKNPVARYP